MRITTRLLWLVATTLILAAVPAPALAQADVEGGKDHPMVPRMPVYYLADYNFNEFEAGTFSLKDGTDKEVEGKHWRMSYSLKEGARRSSELEILRNYRAAFTAKGARQEYYDEPGVGVWVLKQGAGELWCIVRAQSQGEVYFVEIVERTEMAQAIELNASELAKALDEKGSVALHGILFDTGKATIKAESEKILAEIGTLLKDNADLKLEIQGHTDNVGQKAANQTLSQQRAASVRQHLITTLGVDATRLTAVGFGDTKPTGPNTTEEGRAQNRRVELVKK